MRHSHITGGVYSVPAYAAAGCGPCTVSLRQAFRPTDNSPFSGHSNAQDPTLPNISYKKTHRSGRLPRRSAPKATLPVVPSTSVSRIAELLYQIGCILSISHGWRWRISASMAAVYPANPLPLICSMQAFRVTDTCRKDSRTPISLRCTSTAGKATAFSASSMAIL